MRNPILTIARLVLGLLLFLVTGQIAWAQQCRTQNPEEYERDKFIVSSVSVTSDDKSFGSVKHRLPGLLGTLPLQAHSEFSKAALDQSKILAENVLAIIEPPDPLQLPLIHTRFEGCNTTSHPATVKVVFDASYVVQRLNTSSSPPPTYEQPAKDSARMGRTSSWLQHILTTIQLQPYVGFTGSSNLAGAGATVDLNNSVLRSLSLEGAGSSSTAVGSVSVQGNRTSGASNWLRELTWRGGYEYSKLPSGDGLELKRGTGFGQLFASSRAFGDQKKGREFVIRYGGSFEGGNRQSDLDPTSPTIIASGSYQSLKTYIGGSGRIGRHLFKGSYGLLVGGTGDAATGVNDTVDFLKHIFDSSYKTRFLPWNNKPISFEAQFTSGKIDQRGLLPVAESFFAGNIDQNFIPGSDWIIRSSPYIRSFPNQRLTPTGLPLAVGGESFISTNLTLAATFWAKPAIPKEAQTEIPGLIQILTTSDPNATDPQSKAVENLLDKLDIAFVTETDSYVQQIAKADYAGLEEELLRLQVDLNGLPAQEVSTPTANLIARDKDEIRKALTILKLLRAKIVFDATGKFKSDSVDARGELVELILVTVGPDEMPAQGVLVEIIEVTTNLIAQVDPPVVTVKSALTDRRNKLQQHCDDLIARYDTFDKVGLIEARPRSIQFLKDTESQVTKLGRELNIFSVGPVFMFDAARVRSPNASSGFRYGVGPGIQLEFFGLQLRGGYSFNPDRRPGEPKGAVTFSFDVVDIFH